MCSPEKSNSFAQQCLGIHEKHTSCSDKQKAQVGRSTTHASNLFYPNEKKRMSEDTGTTADLMDFFE